MFCECIRISRLFENAPFKWFVVGGWAVDLFLNKETRKHDDIEIGIFRNDQEELFRYFQEEKKEYVEKHNRVIWNGEHLELPIHELYIVSEENNLEILLNEIKNDYWVYRRDERVKRHINEAIKINNDGIPYICPEIALLYKTKNPRDKDIKDFNSVFSVLDVDSRKWLVENITDVEMKKAIYQIIEDSPSPSLARVNSK
jgi:hypothetical protein